MRLLLFFSLLTVFAFLSKAQCKHNQITIFEDYTQCLSGLKDGNGKIILEAEFEVITRYTPFNGKTYFFIQKNGLQGIIDCDLNYQITIDYTSIKLETIQDNEMIFSVEQDGKFGVMNNYGELIIPIIYSKLSLLTPPPPTRIQTANYVRPYYWLANKKGRWGAIDSYGIPIIPFKYSSLDEYKPNRHGRNYGWNRSIDSCYLLAESASGDYGLLKTNGDTLIPLNYDEITVQQYEKDTYITANKEDKETALFDSSGNLLYQDATNSEVYVQWMQKDDIHSVPFAIFQNEGSNGENKVVNLKNGNEAKFYGEVEILKGILLLPKSGSILSSDLQLIQKLEGVRIEADKRFLKENINVYHRRLENNSSAIGAFDSEGNHLFEVPRALISSTGSKDNLLFWIKTISTPENSPNGSRYNTLHVRNRKGQLIVDIPAEEYLLYSDFVNQYETDRNGREIYVQEENHSSPILLVQSNGKWGGLSKQGEVIIPFEYDEFISHWYQRKKHTGIYLKKNGKTGLVDLKGNILLPFIYDDFTANFGGTNYNLVKSQSGRYRLFNPRGETIIDDAEYITSESVYAYSLRWNMENNKTVQNKYVSTKFESYCFAILQDHLFIVIEDETYLYDSINFDSKSLETVVNNILAGKDGRIRYRAENRLERIGSYVVDFHKDASVQLFNLATLEPTLQLDSVSAFQKTEFGAIVLFQNKRMGMLNDAGSDWLIRPNYYWIKPTNTPTKFWVKTTPVEEHYDFEQTRKDLRGGWILIDSSGNNLFTGYTAMAPVSDLTNKYEVVFYSDDSLAGIIDRNYNVVVNPEYDYTYKPINQHFWILNKNEKSQLYHRFLGTSESFDEVSQSPFGRLYFGRKGNNYSIFRMDTSYQYIVRDVPKEVFETYNFLRLMQIAGIRGSVPMDFLSVTDSAKAEPFWELKNEHAYRIFLSHMRPNSTNSKKYFNWTAPLYFDMRTGHYQGKVYALRIPGYSYHINYTAVIENESKPANYSNTRFSNNHVFSQLTYDYQITNSKTPQPLYQSYVQMEDSVHAVSLFGFLQSDVDTKDFVYSYLEDQINNRQLFGVACPDLPQVISELEQSWYFNRSGIVFEGEATSSYTIQVDYKELKKHVSKQYKSVLKELIAESKEFRKSKSKKRRHRFL